MTIKTPLSKTMNMLVVLLTAIIDWVIVTLLYDSNMTTYICSFIICLIALPLLYRFTSLGEAIDSISFKLCPINSMLIISNKICSVRLTKEVFTKMACKLREMCIEGEMGYVSNVTIIPHYSGGKILLVAFVNSERKCNYIGIHIYNNGTEFRVLDLEKEFEITITENGIAIK